MDGWHHHLTWHGFEPTLGRAGESGILQSTGLQRIRHDWVTKQKGIIENVWGLVGRKPLYTWRIASELNVTLFSHSLDNLFQLPSPPKWKSHETNLTGYIHCWVNKKVYVEIFKKVKQFINVTGYQTCLPCWKSNWLQKFLLLDKKGNSEHGYQAVFSPLPVAKWRASHLCVSNAAHVKIPHYCLSQAFLPSEKASNGTMGFLG